MRLKNKNPFLILWICCLMNANSQNANRWYFGNNAGLNFNTNPPTPLTGGQIDQPDNSSTISDKNGNLLFYTNGVNIWNKNHLVMANGSGLIGHTSAGQCAIIIPLPGSSTKYVVFHVTEFSSPGYLNYTVVDMNLSGGLGDVVPAQKNVSLGSGWTEKLCAYFNPADNSYWLLTHKWNSDEFAAFKITSSSITTQSVISAVGSVLSCGSYGSAHDAMGQLTISPDGTKVLNAVTCQNKLELFQFNIATEVVSNGMSIGGISGNTWGTAFSANSSKIYLNELFGQSVYQYDISSYNLSAIIASKTTLCTTGTGGYNFGYMELGPDNKLYIAKPNVNYLSVVNNPDLLGAACGFSLVGPSVGPNTSSHGISRIAYNIAAAVNTTVSVNEYENNSLLRVYPQPFADRLTLETSNKEIVEAMFFDGLGREVFSPTGLPCNVCELKTGFLPSGVYYLRVKILDKFYYLKIVKVEI